MTKKLNKRLIPVVMLVAIAAVGVTVAFMFQKANMVNTFTPAEISCSVHEKLDKREIGNSFAVGSEKSDIRVKNTGTVSEYLRVRLVSYFVDAEGNVSGAEPSVSPEITLNDGWLAGENGTYYYTVPIKPNDFTPVLCQPFALSEKTVQDGTTIYQAVDVFAEAIQAEPTTAPENEWNVKIADGGEIIAVP